jgi:hypothetical protein
MRLPMVAIANEDAREAITDGVSSRILGGTVIESIVIIFGSAVTPKLYDFPAVVVILSGRCDRWNTVATSKKLSVDSTRRHATRPDAAVIRCAPFEGERISTPHCGKNQSAPRARARVRDAVSWKVAR